MYICMYAHEGVYFQTNTHMYIDTHIGLMRTHTANLYAREGVYVYMYVCMYVCMYAHEGVYVCIRMCVCT
jgi:hypothetical protein